MTSTSRWIRLDTTWDHSAWIAALEPEAQLAWVKLLCHVKAHGYAGSVKRLAPAVAARVWGLRVTSVTEMEEAAIADDALMVEGDEWVITGWGERQSDPTAAERMRRYRERQQHDTPESPADDVTRNSRNVTGVTPTETETSTDTSTVHAPARTASEFPVKPRKGSDGQYQYPEAFEQAWAAYPDRDGSNPKVGAYSAFRARVAGGAVPDHLVRAAEHYRQECQSRQREGTQFVMQASTFYGPSEPWREYLEPKANGTRPDSGEIDVDDEKARYEKLLRDNEARRSA